WKTDSDSDGSELARRLRMLRYLLYLGAALLVIGVIRTSTTLNWARSFFPAESEVSKLTDPLIKGIVSSLGTYYTLIMAGIYLPPTLILLVRARELAKAVEPDKQKEWLSDRGLSLSFSQSLPRLLAIL